MNASPDRLDDRAVLVTGANRGLGAALVTEALRRGAGRVYAGTRRPLQAADPRVVPLILDVTDPAHVEAAATAVTELDILINNAGVGLLDDLGDPAVLGAHLAVNLYGPQALTQALLPRLTDSHGAVVNVLSVAAIAALPIMPAYSASKAAAFSLTQSLRGLLAPHGVSVHAVLAGPVDTDMVRDLDIAKSDPAAVAGAIFDGVLAGQEDIFPDPMSAALARGWDSGLTKAIERRNAGYLGLAG